VYHVTVLYHHPEDPAAFDKYYDEIHAPLAAKLPGLRRYSVSRPAPGPDGRQPAYHLVAVLEFDDLNAMGAAMSGDVGQACAADMGNFAQAGATMLTGDGHLVS
jgi:uncharacterized protein (TIGR02118 family)